MHGGSWVGANLRAEALVSDACAGGGAIRETRSWIDARACALSPVPWRSTGA